MCVQTNRRNIVLKLLLTFKKLVRQQRESENSSDKQASVGIFRKTKKINSYHVESFRSKKFKIKIR